MAITFHALSADEKRTTERAPILLKVKLKYPDLETFIERYSVNLSPGGVFIQTRSPKPVDTLVRLEMLLADGSAAIRGEGRIVRVDDLDPTRSVAAGGMAIKFTRLDEASRALIARALAGQGEAQAQAWESAAQAAAPAPVDVPAVPIVSPDSAGTDALLAELDGLMREAGISEEMLAETLSRFRAGAALPARVEALDFAPRPEPEPEPALPSETAPEPALASEPEPEPEPALASETETEPAPALAPASETEPALADSVVPFAYAADADEDEEATADTAAFLGELRREIEGDEAAPATTPEPDPEGEDATARTLTGDEDDVRPIVPPTRSPLAGETSKTIDDALDSAFHETGEGEDQGDEPDLVPPPGSADLPTREPAKKRLFGRFFGKK